MKKILIVAAIICVATFANAASFNWAAANMFKSDGETKYAGTVTLFCTQFTDWSVTATAASGAVKAADTTFSSDKFVAGNNYDFFFTIEDGGKTFTSTSINVAAQQSDTASIAFGNMGPATKTAGNWKSGTSDAPEPTSAMLLLLGMAGLALKRKVA